MVVATFGSLVVALAPVAVVALGPVVDSGTSFFEVGLGRLLLSCALSLAEGLVGIGGVPPGDGENALVVGPCGLPVLSLSFCLLPPLLPEFPFPEPSLPFPVFFFFGFI